MKKVIVLVAVIALVFFAVGCGKRQDLNEGLGTADTGTKPFRIGVVLGQPKPGQLQLNDSLVAGLKQAEEKLGIEYKVLKYGDLVNDGESLRYFAENEYDLVIAGSPEMSKTLLAVAKEFKDLHFAIIDKVVDADNITSILFDEEHGGFLAGVVAAAQTRTGIVGFIGGSQLDEEASRFQSGYLKGIKFLNDTHGKKVKSYVYYAGVFADAMFKPEKGKSLAQLQYGNGADIIFQVAGETGKGVYNAAAEARRYVISNDPKMAEASQWNSHGVVVKKIDAGMFNLVKLAYDKKLKSGILVFGVDNGGVDFLPSQSLLPEVLETLKTTKANLAKEAIKLENIKVPEDLQLKMPDPAKAPINWGNRGQNWNSQGQGGSGQGQNSGTNPNAENSGAGSVRPDGGQQPNPNNNQGANNGTEPPGQSEAPVNSQSPEDGLQQPTEPQT